MDGGKDNRMVVVKENERSGGVKMKEIKRLG